MKILSRLVYTTRGQSAKSCDIKNVVPEIQLGGEAEKLISHLSATEECNIKMPTGIKQHRDRYHFMRSYFI